MKSNSFSIRSSKQNKLKSIQSSPSMSYIPLLISSDFINLLFSSSSFVVFSLLRIQLRVQMLYYLLMTPSTELLQVHNKVLELCELCNILTTPIDAKISSQDVLQRIINDINKTINFVTLAKETDQEYKKLEESIQKKESDIRKHIGLQQQLKLYSESLEQQLDESEYARSQFIEKTRKMISDLKRTNHFLHQQNNHLKQQLSVYNDDDKTRKKAFNIDVDLKKHMRTQSSKDHIQKTPSRHKFTQVYSQNKKSQLLKTKLDMRELLSSVDRKRQIQKKIKQLNQKKTIDQYKQEKPEKLHSNSSYHQLYSKNVESRKDNISKKPQTRSSVRKNACSKKSYVGDDQMFYYQKIHYKTRSIHKQG